MPEQSDNSRITTIINGLRESRELEKQFREQVLARYLIGDKLTSQWAQEMKIEIPHDATPPQCRELLAQVISMIETVHRALRDVEVVEQNLSAAYDREYGEAFEKAYRDAQQNLLQTNGKRMPSEKTLSAIAEGEAAATKQAHHHSKIAVMFFKRLLDKLLAQSEQISRILIALGIEAKVR